MKMNIVDKFEPRTFSAFSSNRGVVLCDKQEGAFLVLRYTEDLENLKELLRKITIIDSDDT